MNLDDPRIIRAMNEWDKSANALSFCYRDDASRAAFRDDIEIAIDEGRHSIEMAGLNTKTGNPVDLYFEEEG